MHVKRTVYSSYLADKWNKLGYKIVALSYWNNEETAMAYHFEETLITLQLSTILQYGTYFYVSLLSHLPFPFSQ